MRFDETNNRSSETEGLGADEVRMAQMLGSLKRIEAPGDFEFRVKARIAKGRPKTEIPSPRRFSLRYFAPLALALMVAGFVGFNELVSPPSNKGTMVANGPASAPSVAEALPVAPDKNIETEGLSAPGSGTAVPAKPARVEVASAPWSTTSQRVPADRSLDFGGGSKTETLRGPKEVINPRGINPEPVNRDQKPNGPEGGTKTSVRELLAILGLDAEPETEGWRVKSAKAKSPADRSGVKSGDVITSIDETKIDADSAFTGNFAVKTLKVLRNGKPITLTLQNK